MTTSNSTTPSATPSAQLQKIGWIVELCGVGAFVVGMILSAHHYAIDACFVGGATAFVLGWKLHS
jgi:hypothetical protein